MDEPNAVGLRPQRTAHVLIIEDDLPQRILTTELLAGHGLVVQSAGTMHDGLEMLAVQHSTFDVVVLDLDLPDCAGFDSLTNAIYGCDAPVIVYSGSPDPDAACRSTAMGARAFVPKSPSIDELVAAISNVLDDTAEWAAPPPLTSRDLTTSSGLTDAITHTLNFLSATLPMGKWMFTRVSGDDWVVLAAEGHEYDVIEAGLTTRWSDSYCSRMVRGDGPMVVDDTDVDRSYATAPINRDLQIGAYCAAPIVHGSHGVFGTLCGISTEPAQLTTMAAETTVTYAATMLASALAADLERDRLQRRFDLAKVASRVDQLTGLGNRRAFDMMCKVEEARAIRYGFRTALAVIDLDGLKKVNDQQGHAAGDDLISRAAGALTTVTRESDIAFRIGGDEFVIIAPQCDPTRLHALAERIDEAVEAAGVSASVGVSCQELHAEPLAQVLARADQQMYAAKEARGSARSA